MSRFFQGGLSDSDSDSSSDEELYGSTSGEGSSEEESEEESSEEEEEDSSDESDEESDSDEDGPKKGPSYYLRDKFLKKSGGPTASSDEESSEDEGRRVVKSAKDKLMDEIDATIKAIDNAKKINDWVTITTEFDKLNRLVDRAQKQYQVVPPVYIKALVGLDDGAAEAAKAEKSAKKKMNASNSRALNTLKQRIKKVAREHSSAVEAFRADPEGFEKRQGTPQPEAAVAPSLGKKKEPVTVQAPSFDDQDDDGFETVGKGGKADKGGRNVFTTLISVVEARGKRNVDRAEQVRTLENLLKSATTPYQKILVLLTLVPVRYDQTSSGVPMPVASWKAAEADMWALFDLLDAHASEFRVVEGAPEPEDIEVGPEPNKDGIREIPGSLVSLVERLDDELTRALQVIDPHTTEYVDRLRDEAGLYALVLRTQLYLEFLGSNEPLARIVARRLDHMYYKPMAATVGAETQAWSRIPAKADSKLTPRAALEKDVSPSEYTLNLTSQLCSVLYGQPNTILRTRAMLSQIYHFALCDKYFEARDMMLMSHLQSSIHTSEPAVQVLFNRALVQVGLCAFRAGLIQECQQALQEVCASARLKELLGQGMPKYGQNAQTPNTPADRLRLLPFHMHINLELLECVYLTASMLIEIPAMAALGPSPSADAKKKVISKPFRRMLDYHDRQVFTGPPENTRDHIMQAARALLSGDWAKARDLLSAIKIWSLFSDAESIKTMLADKLRQEGLRTYLLSYGAFYQTLSLSTLSSLFDLPQKKVAAIASKMISSEEVAAALDQKTNAIVFRQGVELTRLQVLAQSLADKAVQLVERNERLASGGSQLDGPNVQSRPATTTTSQTKKPATRTQTRAVRA
uniref:Eukaryotic translation initiation factor 3 subunit C n=1 Tax=Blastobotrys adeninivorans TaxID=409370 RepID=A0A060TDK6_BLAAD